MRGTPYLFICRQTVSDCGCTPLTAQNTAHGAVEHAQAALDFDGEVDVPGRVDDVDAVLGELVVHPLPEAGGRGRGDRDAALLLLLHVVHDGGAVVHFADLVRNAGVEKDALGRRRLAGVDVRGDTDVPVALDRGGAWHGWNPSVVRGSGRAALPAVVRERLVGVGHAMRVFALAHGGAAVLGGLEQLGREALRHRLLAAGARRPR